MSTSMLREFANQWLTERYGMDFALPNAGNGLSSLMQSSPAMRGNTPSPNPALGSTSSALGGNSEDDDDPAEAANSIADILYHLFGEDALSHLDEVLPMMQYARDWDESKISRHPKGKREGGRFAAKHDAASLQDMHNNIASSLKGQKSPDSAKALASHLGNLTINQLHDLKKQYGISASGRTKQDLVSKIADRLDRGRRTPDEQMPPEEQQQPEQPPEESALPEMPPAGPQAPAGPPIPAPLQKATQRRKAMLEKHLGPQEPAAPAAQPPMSGGVDQIMSAMSSMADADGKAKITDMRSAMQKQGMSPEAFDAALFEGRQNGKLHLKRADLHFNDPSLATPGIVDPLTGNGFHYIAPPQQAKPASKKPSPLDAALRDRDARMAAEKGQEEPFLLKAEPAPRPAPAVKLTNPNTKQQSLFDAGQGDLPGQQTLFDDIGTQGQPEADSGMMEIPMGDLPPQLQGSARGQLMMGIQDGSHPSTQQSLDPKALENTQPDLATTPYEGDPNAPITVAKVGGKHYVLDGHHRKHEAIKAGRPVVANVADLDAQSAPAPQNQANSASPETVPQPSAPAPQVPQAAAAEQPDTSTEPNRSADKIAKLRKSAAGDPNSAMTKAAKNTLKNTFGIDVDKEAAQPAPEAAAKPAPAGITPGADPALNGPEAQKMNDMIEKNQSFFKGVARKYASQTGVDADDLAQQVMLELFQSAPSFKGGEDEMRAFASTIANRRATDMLRKDNSAGRDKRRTSSLDAPMGDNGETMAGNVMDRASVGGRDNRMFDALHKHISHVPDNLRPFAERFLQGESPAAIAASMGLSRETGSQRMKKLGQYLKPFMEAEQYRRKNPRLFGIVESEIDRYFREHTLVDPQVERYFLFGGKSGMLGMLLRGALTAALFSLVNGMQGGGQQTQAAQPKPTPQPAPSPQAGSPFSDISPFDELDSDSQPMVDDSEPFQPREPALFDSPLSVETPTGFGDWFGNADKSSGKPQSVDTQNNPALADTQAMPPGMGDDELADDQANLLDRSGYQDPAKQPETYPLAKTPKSKPKQQSFDADPDNPPQAPKGGASWPSWDDPSHPRHKKGDEQGRGGQFAPKDQGTTSSPPEAPESPETPSAASDDTNDVRQPERASESTPEAEPAPEVTPEPQDQTPATPVPTMPRHAKKAINDVAMEYELDPEELFHFANAEIESQRDYHTQRESKKADARKATGMNAGNLAKLENSGKDASSGNAARRGFDTAATELGMEGDEDVWGLIREGKQDLPKINDPAFLRRMAADLAHMKQNGDMSEPDPMEHFREPTTNDLREFVPFSRPRVGIERG